MLDEPSVDFLIRNLAISNDGRWLASADSRNQVHLFDLQALKHHVTVPSIVRGWPVTALAFHPADSVLVVVFASNHFILYDVEDQRLSDYSREYTPRLPIHLLSMEDHIFSVSFNPESPRSMFLHSHSYFCHIDLEKPLPEVVQHKKRKHRSSQPDDKGTNYRLIDRYRNVVYSDFVGDSTMVIVELPWLRIVSKLPAAMYRNAYGKK
eukprot:TRINITY_DN4239_c0_g1_i4.p1 TRINITY_DN4239_c0_g1~~TRINITY_DN4239_c0_g1_i4.p1  ORF type:complete len:208 (-),score=44.45 TRINITY_DN4239_c0_g1_i4:32-655(-)